VVGRLPKGCQKLRRVSTAAVHPAAKFDITSKKEPLWEMFPWVKEKKLYLT
jgi:hypothetical protein